MQSRSRWCDVRHEFRANLKEGANPGQLMKKVSIFLTRTSDSLQHTDIINRIDLANILRLGYTSRLKFFGPPRNALWVRLPLLKRLPVQLAW
jgi:hypothetical protein